LVVGAGAVGEAKVKSLLRAGAKVRVVAPRATRAVRAWRRAGKVCWEARGFKPADLDGVFLVVAATPQGGAELHEQIFQEARRRGVLCNVVDDPARCDFYYPAVVRRGHLQIAISTGGRSPALAQHLRKELEQQFGPEYETWIEQLGEAREKLLTRPIAPARRRRLLHRLASRQAFEAFLRRRGKRVASGPNEPRQPGAGCKRL
jgi:precorrin-2 dehydrogenase/sirohydrochlorin ferrochelatase